MAQIVAVTSGLEAEAVRVVAPDTDVTPVRHGHPGVTLVVPYGSCRAARGRGGTYEPRCACAAETGVTPGANLPIAELFRRRYGMQAGTIVGTGSYIPAVMFRQIPQRGLTPNATPYWMIGGAAAEVEVDTETGRVRVLRLVNVADAGASVNPRIVETQLTGAAIMQLGFTLLESMDFTEGQLRNPSFAEDKIPGHPRPSRAPSLRQRLSMQG